MRSVSRHIRPLVINNLGGGHTDTKTHVQVSHRNNFKKPGMQPSRIWFNKHCGSYIKICTKIDLKAVLFKFSRGMLPDLLKRHASHVTSSVE